MKLRQYIIPPEVCAEGPREQRGLGRNSDAMRSALTGMSLVLLLVAPVRAGVDRWTPLGPEAGVLLDLASPPAHPATVGGPVNTGAVCKILHGGQRWWRV